MNFIKTTLAASILGIASTSANATVINSSLYATYENGNYASTVDFHDFTMNSTGAATFDILSWESEWNGNEYVFTDLNSDGEIAFVDTVIWIFDQNMDLITYNDDDHVNGTDDGTIWGSDSYLSLNLDAGNYTIAVSTCCAMNETEILDGSTEWGIVFNGIGNDITGNYQDPNITHGDYQLTFTGDLTVAAVPEPSIYALMLGGLGLVGFMATGRRKQA